MERLTKNKATEDMSMYELAYNCCYIDKDGNARYRDFEIDVDARGFVRKIGKEIRLFETGCAELIDDESFDATMIDWLQYGHTNVYGLLAVIYRNLWAMAELRECLKSYEDAEEQGLLLRLPCKVGDTVYSVVEDGLQIFELKFSLDFYVRRMSDFGKTVFLTKEEAEQALAEMKGV